MWRNLSKHRLHFYDGGVVEREWEKMDLAAIQPYWLTEQFPLSFLPRVADTNRTRIVVGMLFSCWSPLILPTRGHLQFSTHIEPT